MLRFCSHTIWLFDYDLTLYGFEERSVLDSLDVNITAFVARHLNVSAAEANVLRKEYCQKFGTTLGGLQVHHGVRPHDYFDFIHSAGELQMPDPDDRKVALLNRLPGTRYVFTNARKDWAAKGLENMGLTDCFADLFDLEFCNWIGKPAADSYCRIEEGLRARGHAWQQKENLVLLDDKPENLVAARERGWSTVLVHPEAATLPGVFDLRIRHLLELTDFLI